MTWYNWVILAITLLVVELLTPGTLVAFFFAIGALLTAFLVYHEIIVTGWIEWLIFSSSAIFCYMLFHPQRWGLTGGESLLDIDRVVGQTVVANEKIAPNGIGKVTYRGTIWKAHNVGSYTIDTDTPSHIIGQKGLTLEINSLPVLPRISKNY
jgi:membrane protein implicated in regulation of membrane protease activity